MLTTRLLTCVTRTLPLRPTITSTALFSTSLRYNANTISDLLKHDHRELEVFKDKILNASSADEKVRWQNQFTWELARHSIGEELVVYPALEEHLDNGVNLAERDRQAHLEVKENLKKFQNLSPIDPSFESTLKSLWETLESHIKEEEQEDLPALEQKLESKSGASESLANSFSRTRMFIPTRSHPSAPDQPPFETIAGLFAAPIDKLADMFRRFPDSSDVKAASEEADKKV